MYNRILSTLYTAFAFSTYMDSLWIASHTHSCLLLTGTCVQCRSNPHLRPLYLKFDNRIKIDFFCFNNRISKIFEFNIPIVHIHSNCLLLLNTCYSVYCEIHYLLTNNAFLLFARLRFLFWCILWLCCVNFWHQRNNITECLSSS